MGKTVTVKSITNPKVDGQYRLPGTVWECNKKLAGELQEIGAVELVPKSKKPSEDKTKSNQDKASDDKTSDDTEETGGPGGDNLGDE